MDNARGRDHTAIVLRQWRDSDLAPFAEMNGDPQVMRFFPAPLTQAQSRQSLERMRAEIDARGWGLWAVEADGQFAGFTGLSIPGFRAAFTPCVEIGWRLRRECWGRSIAYRAALGAETYAFENMKLRELVSFTAAVNTRSRRLMERLGFTTIPADDFPHPFLAPASPLRDHVLYRKPNPAAGGPGAPARRPSHGGSPLA